MYLECDLKAINYLKKKDKILGNAIDKIGVIKRKINPNLFISIVENIIGQQISTTVQSILIEKLVKKIKIINPENILNLKKEDFKLIGISNQKVDYIQNFASAVKNKEINLKTIKKLDDNLIIEKLTKLKGIGVWTAQMILIFSLSRKNVISFEDYGIRKGMEILYQKEKIDAQKFSFYAKKYRPFATIASLYLWEIANQKKQISSKKTKLAKVKSAFYKFKFGYLKINYQNDEINYIKQVDSIDEKNVKSFYSNQVFQEIKNYLLKKQKQFYNIQYKLKGTVFQIKVWQAISKIKYGQTKSYQEIAITINQPKAYRAVGNACNKNPMMIVIPCHRVIGNKKQLGGYASCLSMKEFLLNLEK